MTNPPNQPRLHVLDPHHLRGQLGSVADGWTTIGREDVNFRIDDPYVSRRHAAIFAGNGQATIEDLGSSAGTTVNGRHVQGRVTIQPGDVLGFGQVLVRYEQVAPIPAQRGGAGSFAVGTQTARNLNNVARDQYNSYVHTVVQQRESFLREIAATKTRARWLVTVGLIMFLGGAAVEIVGLIQFGNSFQSINENTNPNDAFKGFDLAYPAAGISAFGLILTIVGIVLHVVAASRRRRIDDRYRVQPPRY